MDKQRLLAIALSVTLVMGLSACGAKPTEQTEPQEPDASMSDPVSADEPKQADTSEPDAQETAGGEDAGTVEPVNSIAPVEAVDPVEADSGWTEVNETVYAVSTVNVRSGAGADTDKVGSLAKGESVTRTGIGTDANAGWSRVEFSGAVSYISSDYLSTEKPVATSGNSSSSGGSQTPPSTPQTGDTQGSSGGSGEKSVGDILKEKAENNTTETIGVTRDPLTQEDRDWLTGKLNGDIPASSPSSGEEQTETPDEGGTSYEEWIESAEEVGGTRVPGYGGLIQFDPDDLM